MSMFFDTLVIGGGQAGLAAGYHLRRAGLSFAILEGASEVGGSWPHYYDSLRLFSPISRSSLPGMRFPGSRDHYPARDEVVAYLRRYALQFHLPIITAASVVRVERADSSFRLITSGGDVYQSRSLIAATGAFHRPYVGLSNQSTYASATLRGVGPDAAHVVCYLRHHLRASAPALTGNTSIRRRLSGGWRCCAGKAGAL